MKPTTVSDNDYTLMISALDSILDDEYVQKKVIEAMKIVETDRRASYMLQAGSGDLEDVFDDKDFLKTEVAWALKEMIDVVSYQKETYMCDETLA